MMFSFITRCIQASKMKDERETKYLKIILLLYCIYIYILYKPFDILASKYIHNIYIYSFILQVYVTHIVLLVNWLFSSLIKTSKYKNSNDLSFYGRQGSSLNYVRLQADGMFLTFYNDICKNDAIENQLHFEISYVRILCARAENCFQNVSQKKSEIEK